jgi:hypothetical protein
MSAASPVVLRLDELAKVFPAPEGQFRGLSGAGDGVPPR